MKSTKFLPLLCCLFIFLVASCSQKDLAPVDPVGTIAQDDYPKSTEGILTFKSFKQLDAFSKSYKYQDATIRESFESKLKFTSLLSYIETNETKIEKKSSDGPGSANSGNLLEVTPSDNLASLVNSNGYLTIGTTLFYFGKKEVLGISIEKSKTLTRAILALTGKDAELKKLVTVSKLQIVERDLPSPQARYDLPMSGTGYSQSTYTRTELTPKYVDCFFCRPYQIEYIGTVSLSNFVLRTEYFEEWAPYDPDCQCYSGIGPSIVEYGYFTYVKVLSEIGKRYANNDIDHSSLIGNYIRMKSTNAVVYINGVAVPATYDVRTPNVSILAKDIYYRLNSYSTPIGTLPQLGVEGTFEFETQPQKDPSKIMIANVSM